MTYLSLEIRKKMKIEKMGVSINSISVSFSLVCKNIFTKNIIIWKVFKYPMYMIILKKIRKFKSNLILKSRRFHKHRNLHYS